jgi:hypothetical protein
LIQKIYKVDPLTCPKCQGKIVLLFLAEFPYLVLPLVPQRIQYSAILVDYPKAEKLAISRCIVQ